MKLFSFFTALFLIVHFTLAQGIGQADHQYIDQSELNSFASKDYDTICNSLVLTANCRDDFPMLSENETLVVDCIYDLSGETITLPSNITLEYSSGGDIINGTLIFNEGRIDGKLLNADLEIEGTASLIESEFEFIPSRWNIIEGSGLTWEESLSNSRSLQSAIDLTKELDATKFSIDKMNAFFTSETRWDYPAKLPSDFHFSTR